MNRAIRRAAVIALSALTLVGCAHAPSKSDETSTSVTSTRTPRLTDNSGRHPVTFDPCLDIPDSTITQAGYDPTTKENADFPGEYTFLGCKYRTSQRQYRLTFLSGNITFEEERQKTAAYAEPIEINGRRALLELKPDLVDSCAISLETAYGILIFSRTLVHNSIGPAPTEEWCAGLEDTARLIEPLLPEG